MESGVSLAVDIGGTFTDVVVRRGDQLFVEKTLTTHEDLLKGFFEGVDRALKKANAKPSDVNGGIFHATTVVTNALIERKGALTAMVFTKGFSDILRIRDERRYDMYDPQIEFPQPLVSQENVFEVDERVLADGSVLRPIDDADVDRLCAWLVRSGIKSLGICLLHSYKNPVNEQALGAALKERMPSLFVSLSSDVASQIREFLRASTTAANAYAVPITYPYLDRIEKRLAAGGYPSRPLIMLSSGGVVGAATAGRLPIRMVESGPAAGALGAAFASRALSLENLLAFDMGGTTAKVCLLQGHQPMVTGMFEIDRMYRLKEGSGLPVTVPCIDMIEIGAGGGSIAHVSDLGLLNVGPQSAGSNPGPACYGRGGSRPTVTDADVVLQVIDASNFLGGAMPLDTGKAERAIATLADALNVDLLTAARGAIRVVCEAMAGAIRTHATERGVDYRGIPLLAFGGAGPVHACEVAQLLNADTVIFPPFASVYSAFGTLVTPARLDLVRSSLSRLDRMVWSMVDQRFAEMEKEGLTALLDSGCAEREVVFEYAADMRYVGQHSDISVALPSRPRGEQRARVLREQFELEYERRFRIRQEVEVEVVNWRVSARGPMPAAPNPSRPAVHGDASIRQRTVHMWQDEQRVSVYSRASLQEGRAVSGPAVIEEPETTIVIPPGWTATVESFDCIVARRDPNPEH